jgi:hypothetical protein
MLQQHCHCRDGLPGVRALRHDKSAAGDLDQPDARHLDGWDPGHWVRTAR